MQEAPHIHGQDDDANEKPDSIHPLREIIEKNGRNLRIAFKTCLHFLQHGHQRGRRKDRGATDQCNDEKCPAPVAAPVPEPDPEIVKPNMHILHPGIPELLTLGETLPWQVGITPAERPNTWRQLDTPQASVISNGIYGYLQKVQRIAAML